MAYWRSNGCGENLQASDAGLPAGKVRRPNVCPNDPSAVSMTYLKSPPAGTLVPVADGNTTEVLKPREGPKGGKGKTTRKGK